MNHRLVRCLLALGVGQAVIAQAVPAFAQNSAGEGATSREIIVAARKRDESILKVPVIAAGLDQEQLTQYQANDIRRVADQLPGLIVGEGASASFGAQLSLRGIGTSVINGTIDQSVSLNIDGQQFTHGLAFTAGMFDLAQVSLFKGPQALFYGKASTGGVIAMRTADPGSDFEVFGGAGYEFEARTKRADLIVSGPVSDTLGLRLAARYFDTEGYFKNIAVPAGFGAIAPHPTRNPNATEWLVRGTAVWKPSSSFDARLKVTYSNKHNRGRMSQLTSCPDGTNPPLGIRFIASNEDCKLDRLYTMVDMDPAFFIGIPRGGRTFSDVEMIFGSLEMNYNVTDDIKVSSVTGYFKVNEFDSFNGGSSGGAGPTLQASTDYTRRDITEEIRIVSDFPNSPVNFTLGGFIEDVNQFKTGIALGNRALRLPVFLSNGTHDNPWQSQSLFGQLLWKVTPQLELAGGLRWTHEKREHTYFNFLIQPNAPIALAVPKISSNRVSPEVTLTYTPTDNLTVFAAFKKGYKSGSHNSSGSFRNGDDTSFADERVIGGEAGVKFRSLDRAFSMNLAGYYYKYNDLQVGANAQQASGLIVVTTLNAASAKVYGLDFDATYRPPSIDGLTLRAAASWNHSRYIKFDNAPCYGGQRAVDGCNTFWGPSAVQSPAPVGSIVDPSGLTTRVGFFSSQDLSGRELLRAPDFTASLGFDLERPLGDEMKIQFGSLLRYSSKYYADILLRSDQLQPAYAKLNARVTLKGPDDRWELSVIGNNLTDKLIRNKCSSANIANGNFLGGIITGGTTRGSAGVDEVLCSVDAGREVWVQVGFKF